MPQSTIFVESSPSPSSQTRLRLPPGTIWRWGKPHPTPATRRCGFTLVELLVTIAIIGILLSLLMPALGRARDHANLVVCKNRLRSVTFASLLYAEDNRDFLPIDRALGPGYGSTANPHTDFIRSLTGYVEDPQSYYCPSETDPAQCFSEQNYADGVIGYFYFSCTEASSNSDISVFLRWRVPWPRYLRNDLSSETWVISDAWYRGRPTNHRWFKKGVNYAVLDGSVNMLYKSPRRTFK